MVARTVGWERLALEQPAEQSRIRGLRDRVKRGVLGHRAVWGGEHLRRHDLALGLGPNLARECCRAVPTRWKENTPEQCGTTRVLEAAAIATTFFASVSPATPSLAVRSEIRQMRPQH